MRVFISGSSHDDIPMCYKNISKKVSLLFNKDNSVIVGGIPDTFPKDSMMGIYDSNFKNHMYVTVEKYDSDNKPRGSKVFYYTMDRTREIYKNSDVIIFLPGGIGTFSEVFGMIEEARTNICKKKIILFNYMGYFDNVIDIINKGISDNFISESDTNCYVVVNNINELKKEMEML